MSAAPSPSPATAGPCTQAAITALLNRAQALLLTQAWLGKPEGVAFARGSINALKSLQSGRGELWAAKDANLKLGYEVNTYLQRAWPGLPEGLERLTMAEVQQHLCSKGIELAADTVAHRDIDGIAKLENDAITLVNADDEHDAARTEVGNGTGAHTGSFLVGGAA